MTCAQFAVRSATLLTALLMVGCGGGDGSTKPTEPTTRAVAAVDVAPGTISLIVGDGAALTATARDAQGGAITGRSVTWSSDAPVVASVSADGRVSAVGAGSAHVRATIDGVSGTATITVTALAAAVTQSIGTQGGTFGVNLANGVAVQLAVPAGALTSSTTLGIEPTRPPTGALASFALSPLGTSFTKPVVITLTLPSAAGTGRTAALTFQGAHGTQFVPLSGQSGGTVVTGTIATFGEPAVFSSRLGRGPVAPAASTAGSTLELILAMMAVQEVQDSAAAAITLMNQHQGDFVVASHLGEVMTVLVQMVGQPNFAPRGTQLLGGWAPALCPNVDAVMARLKGLSVASPFDYPDFNREVNTASGWQGLALTIDSLGVQPDCVDHYGEAIDSISTHFTKRVISDLLSTQGLNLLVRFSDFLDQFIPKAVGLVANLELLTETQSASDVRTATAVTLDTLRSVAWRACRSLNDQSYLALLHLLTQSSAGPLARFDNAALDDDAEECGTDLTAVARDSTGTAQASAALGGVRPGQVNRQPAIDMPPSGRIVIAGLLAMLQCPGNIKTGVSPSDNSEALHVSGGVPPNLSVLTQRTVGLGGPREYLHNDSIVVTDAQLRAAANIPAGNAGTASIRLERVGLSCGGGYIALPDPALLGELVVTLASNQCASPRLPGHAQQTVALSVRRSPSNVAAVTASCPLSASISGATSATVGDQYSAQVSGIGGGGNYTYQLFGEPPDDVVLNSLTGTFSGQIVESGTFKLGARVTSGADHVNVTLTLLVAPFPIPPLPPPSGNCPDIIVATSGLHAVAPASDSLKHLTCIDNLLVVAGPVSFDQLTKVEEAIAVEFAGANASFPKLQSAGSTSFSGANAQTSIDLSTLQTVWGLSIDGNPILTSLKLGPMTVNGSLSISSNPGLTDLSGVSCGITVNGTLTISDNVNVSQAEALAKAACMNVKGRRSVFANKP